MTSLDLVNNVCSHVDISANTRAAESASAFTWLMTVLAWRFRFTTRRQLRQLDERFLDDIGMTLEQAKAEFLKPFWKA